MSVDIAQLGFRFDSLEAEVAAMRLKNLGKAAKEAETAADRLGRSAIRTGKSMQKMGRTLSMYVTTPILALAAASAKLGVDFDGTMSKMVTLVGLTRTELAGFRKELLKMAPALEQSPTGLADALFAVTSAGQRGAQALDTLRHAAKATMIGMGDTRAIALVGTAAVQAYGAANMDAAKAIDILVGTVEQGNVAAEQLAPVMGRVIGIAAEMGVKFEDLGAFIAVFTRLGVDAAEATTALRGILATVKLPTDEAVEALAGMEMTIDDLRKSIKERGMIVTMQDLVNASAKFGVDMAAIVPNVRALSGVLGVFQADGTLAEEVLKNVAAAIGTMDERVKAAKELDPASAFNEMKVEIQSLMIEISGSLLPGMIQVAEKIRDWIKTFRDLTPEIQAGYLKFILITAAVGPFLLVLGSLFRIIGTLLPLLVRLGIALGPAGAIYLGVTLLIQKIGNEYVESIERAITSTSRFQSVLNTLDLRILKSKLMSASEEIDSYIRQIQEQIEVIEQAQINASESGVDTAVNQELVELEQMKRELANVIRLRDIYTARVRDGILQENEELEVLKEIVVTATAISVIPRSDSFDPVAFDELRDSLDPAAAAMRELTTARKLLDQAFARGKKGLKGGIGAEEFDKLSSALNRSALAFEAFGTAAFRLREFNQTIKNNLADNMEFVDGLEAAENAFTMFERSLIPSVVALKDWQDMYNEAFQAYVDSEGEITPERWERLQVALEDAEYAMSGLGQQFQRTGSDIASILSSMADGAESGSSAQRLLALASQATNTVLAIQAILTQGQGDPYTAFGRMAAMAAAVAPLIASVINFAGSGGHSVASRTTQEAQGTGTVLGDTEAKSESILNATEITADATSELVGINRGMLHALQNLETGLGGASVQLARGSGDIDFGALPNTDLSTGMMMLITTPLTVLIDKLLGGFLTGIVNKILGGKAKLLDYGIQIVGGSLNDVINETMVQAWQEISVKKWVFGSTKIKDRFQELDDEVVGQFALVLGSIRDAVTEAALALGIPLADIEARIAAFQIATTNISFKDLDAEEQREELLAVFGSIFDGLAGDVVPFIDQFQKVGEGLGETLVRVATSVQVFREAVDALGFVIDTTDPELFAQIAVGLVELTGGVENFISMFTTFFDLFASEEQKLEFITNQVTRAFEGVGLTLPKTRDAIFDLMMTLDATTEEGRRQIAMLLELAPVLDEYYSLMEEGTEDLINQAREFADIVAAFVGIGDSSQLRALKNSFNEAMEAAKSLNATQKEYAMITRAFNMQLKRMAAELTLSVLSLMQQLFGENSTYGDPINDGLEETREVANSVFGEWQRALEDIYDYTQQLLLDENLTTLTPAEQLSEAQKQFNDILAKAQAGDVDAAAALPKAAQALLEEARFMFASGQQYTDIFDTVLAALNSVKIPANVPEFIKEEEDKNAGIVDPIVSAIDEQTKALQRYLQALDLAATLRDLSRVLDVSVITLAQELGVPLRELAQILGVKLDPIDNTTAEAIGDLALALGADIFELMEALGVDLFELAKVSGVHIDEMSADLVAALGDFAAALGVDVLKLIDKMGIPIAELAKTFGIGIDQFSAEQFKALVAFSASLGAGITDVAEALNINLGDIRDATSILSQALGIAIGELPPDIQLGLGPYLEAIREATNDADANNAIDDLGKYVLSLPPDIAAPLIPFLEAMGFENIAPELSMLYDIEKNTRNTVEAILKTKLTPTQNKVVDIADKIKPYVAPVNPYVKPPPQKNNLDPIKYDPYKKGFATGGYVGQTGMHQLHAGEFVINKSANNVSPTQDNELTVLELSQIRTVLADIRDQQRRYQEADLATTRNIESSMKLQAEQTRRVANG